MVQALLFCPIASGSAAKIYSFLNFYLSTLTLTILDRLVLFFPPYEKNAF